MSNALRNQLMDASVRIERVIWLDGIDWNAPGDVLEGLIEDGFESAHESACWLKDPPPWVDMDDKDMILEWLYDKEPTGYLVEASRPVPTILKRGVSSHSWGNFETRVFYAETVEATVPMIVAWADGIEARAIADWEAKA